MRLMVRMLSLAALTAAAGCYTYAPARPADVVPESRVKVTVTPARAAALAEGLRGSVPTFNATYVSNENGSLLFSVPLRGAQPGLSTRGVTNRVTVPTDDIVSLETRSLSRWRTATVVALGLTVLGFGVEEAFSGRDDVEGNDRGEVDNILVPLFSLPVGWGR